MRRCTQTKCSFYTQGGCKNCKTCNAEPYNINTKCRDCIMCESEDGHIRFGDNNQLTNEVPIIIINEKPIEVKNETN